MDPVVFKLYDHAKVSPDILVLSFIRRTHRF